MKKVNKVIIGAITVLTVGLFSVSNAVTFTDTTGHWAEANITSLASQNIINGYEDGTFRPNGAIKKGEFIKLMMSSALPGQLWNTQDTNYNHWSGTYISVAERLGILDYGKINAENANDEITRGEVVEILGTCDIILNKSAQQSKNVEFHDVLGMTAMQDAMLRHCVSVGYIQGYNDLTFKPEKTLTRAEIATILTRYLAN